MPRGLVYAPQARDDIAAARRWLTQPGSGPTARSTLLAVLDAAEDLRQHAHRFPLGPHPGIRERLCPGGYRILYRVTPEPVSTSTSVEVRVLRIYGPGQDRSTPLA